MSTSDKDDHVSALGRFKRSVSRMTSKRRDKMQIQPDTASEKSPERLATVKEPTHAVQEQSPAYDSWKVDPLLESFSERLHDVLDVHTAVSKAQKSLKAAERVTAALKEQSATALEIAKQDFCFAAKKDSEFSRAAKSRDANSREIQRRLDALEGEIMCGTLGSLQETINKLERAHDDIPLAKSSDEQTLYILKKIDELKRLLIDRLLAKKEQAVQDTEVFKISSLLGQLTSPRVELQCLLDHYSTLIGQKVSSDIVSLSVSSTVQFAREDESLGTPSRLSSDIGFTMMSMLMDAHDLSQDLVERHSLKILSNIFDVWAQQQVRKTCEVLLRLVILPMAVPKGFQMVSECISLFQNYCRAIETATKIHLQNIVISVLKSPFLDMYMKWVEAQGQGIVCYGALAQKQDFIKQVVEILAILKSHEYIVGHERLSIARKAAQQYVDRYVDGLPAAEKQTQKDLKYSFMSAILDG